jgi:hypothetical protein
MDLINQSPMKRVQTVMNLSAKTIVDEEYYGKSINKYYSRYSSNQNK